jgi:4-amino-4-deoxy-L-arabinose transferase-like glycosyltransferase
MLLVLGVFHVALALLASRGNSSTFDEPVHTLAAFFAVHGDLSLNPEHPPLWKYLAGLPLLAVELHPERSPAFSHITTDPVAQWQLAVDTLYRQGIDGESIVARSRIAISVLGGLLVLIAGLFASRLVPQAPRRAALLTALLLALDPLLLAHTPIVSNDVAITLALLTCLWTAWEIRCGTRPYLLSVLLGLCLAAAVTTKYTGLIALPLCAGLFLIRRKPRVLPLLIALPVAYAALWAIYGFHYAPSPTGALIDSNAIAQRVDLLRQAASPNTPPPIGHDLPTETLLTLEHTHLLPQAFTSGLLYSYGVTRGNPALAAGSYSNHGFLWYFPFAIAVKTPLALLALYLAFAWRKGHATPIRLLALALLLALTLSPLNIGIRHALPLTCLLTLLTATYLSTHWHQPRFRKAAFIAIPLLAIETLAAFPHFIPFFNLPATLIGPDKLLADSNLDWGQDLARLAEWRKLHPEGTLYLAYWGTADPATYGLTVTHLPGTYDLAATQSPADPSRPGYVAVSVTYLQGLTRNGVPAPFFSRLATQPELATAGKTIHIYRWPPR